MAETRLEGKGRISRCDTGDSGGGWLPVSRGEGGEKEYDMIWGLW